MSFAQFTQISLSFGDRDILKDVSVKLQAGTKAALTGANGSGKSTLIKVIAGIITPDSGETAIQKDTRIAYLPQAGITHRGCTLKEEADRAFAFGYELEAERDRIGDLLAKNPEKPQPLLEKYHELTVMLEESGWYRRDALAEQILLGLGFERTDFDRRTEEFSGGWQMRIALAKVLMQNPDILLLDEPTNYLDLEARTWLEQFLKDYTGGFLLVSHDRYFLDVTVNEVYELFNGVLHRYTGNYTHYEQVRKIELDSLISRYEQQQEEIRHLEDFIRRFGAKATKAAQAQERQKMLDRIERIEIPETLKKIHFTFPPAPHSGRLVVTIEDLTKSYDGVRNVLDSLSLVIENGDHLVVAGRNGSGKTTLLRILAGEDSAYSGRIKLGAGVSVGYFSQDSAEKLSGSMTVLELLEQDAPLELIPKLRDMLGAFLFRGDDVFKQINVLSGGEKSRLALLKLLLRPVNLLILDEPTNHLDMHSKDVLLDALRDFGGTVIFVSHDRGFIESLADRVLELTPGKARVFPGGYRYYLEQTENSGTVCDTVSKQTAECIPAEKPCSAVKASWEEEKRLKAERRRLEREEEKLMNEITAAEEEKSSLERRLADPAVYSNGLESKKIQNQIESCAARIEQLNMEWERVSSVLADL